MLDLMQAAPPSREKRPAVTRSRRDAASNNSALAQLRFPLVFFGLALTVIEGAFTGVLLKSASDAAVTEFIGSLMAILFLAAIVSVTFLTYRVPTHIMLSEQTGIVDPSIMTARIRQATLLLIEAGQPGSPAEFVDLLARIERILNGDGQ